jgi:Ca2+-binding RTX toxin-like protein
MMGLDCLEPRILFSDIESGSILKIQNYHQAGDSAPNSGNNTIDAQVIETAAGTVTGATMKSGVLTPLTLDSTLNEFGFEQNFASEAALSSAFPNGKYKLIVKAVNDGTNTFVLTWPTQDAFPMALEASNYTDLQSADPSQPVTINWAEPGDASAGDFIHVKLYDASGNLIYHSPFPGTVNGHPTAALSGTATSATIPTGILEYGKSYSLKLQYLHVAATDTTDYPGGIPGYAIYEANTSMKLATVPIATFSNGDLTVTGSSGDDTITLQNDNSGNVTATLNGQTSKAFALAQVTAINVLGGAGNDTITIGANLPGVSVKGGAGDDIITGGDGNDALSGQAGNDSIVGGADNDSMLGGPGNDTLVGQSGDDTLLGGADDDFLRGSAGNDSLDGGTGTNKMKGNRDDNIFVAVNGTGDEIFAGVAVNDILNYSTADSPIIETGVIPPGNQILVS